MWDGPVLVSCMYTCSPHTSMYTHQTTNKQMKALYHSLRAQGLSIALRDHGKELFLSQPGTYYLRYSSTTPEFLTIEVKPPRTWLPVSFFLYRVCLDPELVAETLVGAFFPSTHHPRRAYIRTKPSQK